MTWPFKPKVSPEPSIPDETTQDRAIMLARQHAKLRRAHDLKRRSQKVAESLSSEGSENHYAKRLRWAAEMALSEGKSA